VPAIYVVGNIFMAVCFLLLQPATRRSELRSVTLRLGARLGAFGLLSSSNNGARIQGFSTELSVECLFKNFEF
jgi:hypothetical protein